MPVAKIYTKADVKAAIDRANYKMFKQWRSVRSDLTGRQFANLGKDVGHTFRHVEGTAEGDKSSYENEETALQVTMELLNSAQGQKMLRALDKASPEGSFVESDPANRRIEGAVVGEWYGFPDATTPAKVKIERAVCQVMKLGADVLWIHTSYPTF